MGETGNEMWKKVEKWRRGYVEDVCGLICTIGVGKEGEL
jgi:hypothetical protein